MISHLSKEIDRVKRLAEKCETTVKKAARAIKRYNPEHDNIDEMVEIYQELRKIGK